MVHAFLDPTDFLRLIVDRLIREELFLYLDTNPREREHGQHQHGEQPADDDHDGDGVTYSTRYSSGGSSQSSSYSPDHFHRLDSVSPPPL